MDAMNLSWIILFIFFVSVLILVWCRKRSTPYARCSICNEFLHEYIYPRTKQLVGLRCVRCKRDWIKEDHARYSDHQQENVVICQGSKFYLRTLENPSLRMEPPCVPIDRSRFNRLKPGDHIKTMGSIYSHHAIVVKVYRDPMKVDVIHFTTMDGVNYDIKLDAISLEDYGDVRRVDYEDNSYWRDDNEVIIARAFFLLKWKNTQEYDLFQYNCESLATFCSFGTPITFQVQNRIRQSRPLGMTSGSMPVTLRQIFGSLALYLRTRVDD